MKDVLTFSRALGPLSGTEFLLPIFVDESVAIFVKSPSGKPKFNFSSLTSIRQLEII